MTTDKEIEAALSAWCVPSGTNPNSMRWEDLPEGCVQSDITSKYLMRRDMKAALEAAEKVRMKERSVI